VYKTQRLPSYCDRVLWKSMPPLASHVQLQTLSHLPNVTTSDHKPVTHIRSMRVCPCLCLHVCACVLANVWQRPRHGDPAMIPTPIPSRDPTLTPSIGPDRHIGRSQRSSLSE
jgi:hypothetical protein